jgi:serine/threonine-protein kinase
LTGTRELRIGSPVLGYQVEALVGRGGMGVVYRVFDPALHRHVALKLIAPELALDEAFRERFLQESRAVAALEHPNVVPVYSAGQLEDTLYLAMRYVEGSDLRQLLADGPLPPERAIGICAQVAAALDAAHERGLVHRDVKPSNILVGDGDHVYLGDFGLSRGLEASGPAPGPSLGTIAYVAPEQIRGDPVDGRADVYSLACVLYECLTGNPPFTGGSDVFVLFAHLEVQPPTLPELESVLTAGLAKDPDDRYPTCAAMVEEARRSLRLAPQRRLWPVIGLVAAVVVAIAVGIALAAHRPGAAAAAPDSGGRLAAIDARSGSIYHVPHPLGDHPDGVAAGREQVWVTTSGAAGLSGDAGLWKVDVATGDATRISLGGPYPRNVVLADGEAWVGVAGVDVGGEVQRFDRSGAELSTVPVPGDPVYLGAGSNRVWVAGDRVYRLRSQGAYHALKQPMAKIRDPAHRNDVRIRWSTNGIAVGPDGVWMIGDSSDQRLWQVRGAPHVRAAELGFPPSAVADGDGAVWVTDQLNHRLARIDPATRRVTKFIHRVGSEPMAVIATRSGVWVASAIDRTVSQIDPHLNKVVKTYHVGFSPTALSYSGHQIWVVGNAA